MKYQQLMKQYYGDINNLSQLLQSMVNSYRLLIAGAAELNNINEAQRQTNTANSLTFHRIEHHRAPARAD